MRLRNLLLFLALGTFVAVLPAMASSETTPEVSAKASGAGVYGESFSWAPSDTTVAQGGSVNFSTGTTAAPHGIVWVSPPAQPTCASTVPVGETAYAEHWHGTCSFTAPGVYHFHCSVHTTEMVGTITVTAAGTTTTTMTTTPPPAPTPTGTTPTPTPQPVASHLTRAQKLTRALKACHKLKGKRRKACIRRAHRRYGPKKR